MNALIKNSEDLIETMVDDELVVVSLKNGEFYSLKGTALAIWQAIDGKCSRDALVESLGQKYDIGEADLPADVDAFVDDLRANGFVRS